MCPQGKTQNNLIRREVKHLSNCRRRNQKRLGK